MSIKTNISTVVVMAALLSTHASLARLMHPQVKRTVETAYHKLAAEGRLHELSAEFLNVYNNLHKKNNNFDEQQLFRIMREAGKHAPNKMACNNIVRRLAQS